MNGELNSAGRGMDVAMPPDEAAGQRLWWLAAAVLVVLWGYAVYCLGPLWNSNEDYAFGWFMPLLCLCLFWERWKNRPAPTPVCAASGTFLLLGLFALALLPADLFLVVVPTWRFAGWFFALGIASITIIVSYLVGGRSWCRYFVFPILFFLTAVPWPARLEQPLVAGMSSLNADVSAFMANMLGTPAVRNGTLIEIGAGIVGVNEACSGIRSMQASIVVALFLGELFRYGFLRRLFLLICSIALAFACNVVRTTYLVRMSDLKGLTGFRPLHDQAGFVILGVTLAGLLLLVWWLRPRRSAEGRNMPAVPPPGQEEPEAESDANPEYRAPAACTPRVVAIALVGIALWIGILAVGIELWFSAVEGRAVSQSAWSVNLPVGSREFAAGPLAQEAQGMLRSDEGKDVRWRDDTGRQWQLYYLRWFSTASRYRATVTTFQSHEHQLQVCLPMAGMVLSKDLGTEWVAIKGVWLKVDTEQYVSKGRTFSVAACYWDPVAHTAGSGPQALSPSTDSALRTALRAIRAGDRGRYEKRVIKIGVWDVLDGTEAKAAIREYLQTMISG